MKNSLNVEVTRPNDVLIIMRGVPGSGKSTVAKRLVGDGIIHSTDEVIEAKGDYNKFFEDMLKSGDYKPFMRAHSENNRNVKKSILDGVSPIILDNTNIKANECKEVVEFALRSGYADENIEFIEVGTGGVSAEELAARNTHGVSLAKIESKIQSYKSVGPMSVKKVIEAKSMHRNNVKLFASVVLDESSQKKLYTALKHHIPEGWEVSAHHMTINFGKGLGKEREDDKGKTVELVASEIGVSESSVAVKVHGYPSDNEIPHITLAYNKAGGAVPRMSNDITDWKRLDSHINLRGIINEQKLS